MPRKKSIPQYTFLITAGPTREHLDPVRYLSNESSGRMGFALAATAARRGHRVILVHGPVAIPVPPGVETRAVVSAAEMLAACRKAWRESDALIMAAAVADYTPIRAARSKIKKSATALTLELKPTADILATLAARRAAGQVVMGFALEDRSPRRNAESKLKRKGLDAIVLNAPTALSSETSQVELLIRGEGWRRLEHAKKERTAERLVRETERLLAKSRSEART